MTNALRTNDVMVDKYIQSLREGEIRDWFYWPPDVFALVANLFRLTGCYRVALWTEAKGLSNDPDCQFPWLNRTWQPIVEKISRDWMKEVGQLLAKGTSPTFSYKKDRRERREEQENFDKLIDKFIEYTKITSLNDLKVLRENFVPANEDQFRRFRNAVILAHLLITLNAIADQAGAGFGLPYAANQDEGLAEFYGNLLLTTYGSLATLPKHVGIVLPKMRTPQSGVTPRSTSHHLTFHVSEVEVMWRTLPWPNQTENTLNIVCVPLPHEVHDEDFVAKGEKFQSVRYFDFKPSPRDEKVLTDSIAALVKKSEQEVSRVHILAFPEMGLTLSEFKTLLSTLKKEHADKEGGLNHIPFVIAGVRNEEDDADIVKNEVRLAAYFAGSWYETAQHKHHRWKLDGHQIQQYHVEGRLPTGRSWYEDIPVMQRRLTFIAPNGWLTLCPLICEDLAQLEPVASVIRGVGPTLMFALLSDGPQLTSRWSARYASVLADDPGTAVLTLTSLGMASRSRMREILPEDPNKPKNASGSLVGERLTVALWRDQVNGWFPVKLHQKDEKDKNQGAFLITVAADWIEEFALDGRSDGNQSARFRVEGFRSYPFEVPAPKQEAQTEEAALGIATESVAALPSTMAEEAPLTNNKEPRKESRIATWTDLREFSALIYGVDALMSLEEEKIFADGQSLDGEQSPKGDKDARTRADLICNWICNPQPAFVADQEPARKRVVVMLTLLRDAQRAPLEMGTDVTTDLPWPTSSLRVTIPILRLFAERLALPDRDPRSFCIVPRWRIVFERIIEDLEELWRHPGPASFFYRTKSAPRLEPNGFGIRYKLRMIALQNLHSRLDASLSNAKGRQSDFSLVTNLQDAADLLKQVSESLNKYAI